MSFLFNAESSERDFFNLSANDQSHARSEVLPVEFYPLKGSEGRRAKFGYRLFMRYHPLTILEPLARSLLSPPSMNRHNLKQITRDRRIGIYEWICFDADRLNRFLLDTGTLLPDAVKSDNSLRALGTRSTQQDSHLGHCNLLQASCLIVCSAGGRQAKYREAFLWQFKLFQSWKVTLHIAYCDKKLAHSTSWHREQIAGTYKMGSLSGSRLQAVEP